MTPPPRHSTFSPDNGDPLTPLGGSADALADLPSRLEIFHGYIGVLVVAFAVTLLATPMMRALAVRVGVVDRPSDPRKVHRMPVAYLGGVAVWLGLLCGIGFAAIAPSIGLVSELISFHDSAYVDTIGRLPVPISILLGMTVALVLGLFDDVASIHPRVKIAGLFAVAAALAYQDVGVKVAAGVLGPTIGAALGNPELTWLVPIPGTEAVMPLDVIYWAGTAVIAIFVLGGCNAANLVDGLDGLLPGITAIAAAGLLIIALSLAAMDAGPRDAQRIILCMALLGATLGFLPHNFNPATIFLGDAGSLLLGFTTIVIILTLGDQGQTQYVVAGLVIYAIPIIDTVLAIVRRKLAGRSISEADDQHLHHMLSRTMGVKGAAFTLYGIAAGFAAMGVLMTLWRARVIYALALVFASYIAVIAIKMARRAQIERAAHAAAPGLRLPLGERVRRLNGHDAPAEDPQQPSATPAPATAGE